MGKRAAQLQYETPAAWTESALRDINHFLADHANCERKASSTAMSMVVRFHDRREIIPTLTDLAIEELDHFRQCYRLMHARNIPLLPDTPDPYIRALLKLQRHGRDEHFLDQLLIFAIVEMRGAERFRLVHQACGDEELRAFYKSLWAAEAKHGHLFREMARIYFDDSEVDARMHELLRAEADIVRQLPWRSALH
ncbi:MAG: tRNA-(ms[2]io[6]A)-hydroxylase [Zetaproteobacteria bacterium]|nr:MAG: tRNA-(ms[2]io[6]A)-hydroxylase [Zetaproteobacteria bacterium]